MEDSDLQKLTKMFHFFHHFLLKKQIQRGSEYQTSVVLAWSKRGWLPNSLVFKWSKRGWMPNSLVSKWLKRGWMPNGLVFKCHLNTGQMDAILFSYVLVQYSVV